MVVFPPPLLFVFRFRVVGRKGIANREPRVGNRESGGGNRESRVGNRASRVGNRESVGNYEMDWWNCRTLWFRRCLGFFRVGGYWV